MTLTENTPAPSAVEAQVAKREVKQPAQPTHGWTRHGHPVHGRVIDHMPTETTYQRFNKRVAVCLTKNVGSMTAFWIFWLLCFTILPSCLHEMGVIPSKWILPAFFLGFGFNLLITWFLSTCLELVLMPAIMVGQNIQNEAADARSAKSFEDTEVIVDRLDEHTAGGIRTILDRLDALEAVVTAALPQGVKRV
jgi:hypothetical protein